MDAAIVQKRKAVPGFGDNCKLSHSDIPLSKRNVTEGFLILCLKVSLSVK